MSERIAEVIEIKMIPHENADSLSIVMVEGFSCVVRTTDWKEGQLAVYIRPDEIVDVTRPEFAWLKDPNKEGQTSHRVKAKKLRGIWSMGCLVPAPEGSYIGQDYWEEWKIQHYEPELHIPGVNLGVSRNVKAPAHFNGLPKYDIENARGKYGKMFIDGEPVFVQEKLHGANTSVTFTDGKHHVHSRTMWPEDNEGNKFWEAVRSAPGILAFTNDHPNWLLYGETYGINPGFYYDCSNGKVKFRAFDIMDENRKFLNCDDFLELALKYDIPIAPAFDMQFYDFDLMCKLAESKSELGVKISEGIVVRPITERYDIRYGRVIGKFINPKYLEIN